MEKTNFSKLTDVITSADLQQADKEFLISTFSLAADADLESVVALIAEDSGWLPKIVDNLHKKAQVIVSKNPDAWRRIVLEEERMLTETPAQG